MLLDQASTLEATGFKRCRDASSLRKKRRGRRPEIDEEVDIDGARDNTTSL